MFYVPDFNDYQRTMTPQKKNPEDYAVTDILYRGYRCDGIKHMLRVNLY